MLPIKAMFSVVTAVIFQQLIDESFFFFFFLCWIDCLYCQLCRIWNLESFYWT